MQDHLQNLLRREVMRLASEEYEYFSVFPERSKIDSDDHVLGKISAAWGSVLLERGLVHQHLSFEQQVAAIELFHKSFDRLVDSECLDEPHDPEVEDPAVAIWIGGAAWGQGPWGTKIRSRTVALYLADFLQISADRSFPGNTVSIEIANRKRVPCWILANSESTRKLWADWSAEQIERFEADGWRTYPELLDGSGAVPQ